MMLKVLPTLTSSFRETNCGHRQRGVEHPVSKAHSLSHQTVLSGGLIDPGLRAINNGAVRNVVKIYRDQR